MEIFLIISSLVFIVLFAIVSYKTIDFTRTMWKFKNRKKDGSEDNDFKYFD